MNAKHTFYWSTTYIQKRAQTTSVQLKEFSQNRHAQVTSNRIKEQNIQGTPLCPFKSNLHNYLQTALPGFSLDVNRTIRYRFASSCETHTVSCVCLHEYPFSLLCRASLCEYTITCLSIQHGHVGTFQFGVIMNSASMNFLVHFSWWIYIHISFG